MNGYERFTKKRVNRRSDEKQPCPVCREVVKNMRYHILNKHRSGKQIEGGQ